MTERERERDDSIPDRVPAGKSTNEDVEEEKTADEKDATVDHASEQSMDASDPPAW